VERHKQRARQNRLPLIEQVDCLSNHVSGNFLIESARRQVVRCLLLYGSPAPPTFSHGDHEGVIGTTCISRPWPRNRRINLVGDGSQCRGGGFGARYLAHLLHAAPHTGGGKHTSISSSRQVRGNHSIERTRSQLGFVADVRFVTQV
jgi:hypothetical protein